MKPIRFCLLVLLLLSAGPLLAQWQVLVSGTTSNLVAGCFVNDQTGFVLSSDGIVLKTVDQGITWTQVADMPGTFTCIYPANADTLYAGGDRLFRSDDGGNSWIQVITFPYVITDMGFFSPHNGWLIAPGTQECDWSYIHYIYDFYPVYHSVDLGVSWTYKLDALNAWSRFQFINDSTAYVPGCTPIFYGHCQYVNSSSSKRTTNKGTSWSDAGVAGCDNDCYWFLNPDTAYFMFPSSNHELFRTNDGAHTFTESYSEFSSGAKQCRFINLIDGYLLDESRIYVTRSEGIEWITDYTSGSALNKMFYNPAKILFAVGTNGTILRKTITESLYPDSVYRIRLDNSAVFFGQVSTDSTAYRQVTVTNTGNMPLDLTFASNPDFPISFGQDIYDTTLTCTLARARDTVVNIRFHPALAGPVYGFLKITAPGMDTVSVPIHGTGFVKFNGLISHDTLICVDTWLVPGNITVMNGVTMTICPGTHVQFQGNYHMTVNGALVASGDSLHPIVFSALYTYGGIQVRSAPGNDTTVFRYCKMLSDIPVNTLEINRGSLLIDHCSIRNPNANGGSVVIGGTATGMIQNSEFFECGSASISISDTGSAFIRNNEIHDCGSGSISISDTATAFIDNNEIFACGSSAIDISGGGSGTITNNDIHENFNGIIFNSGKGITITNNRIYDNIHRGIDGIGSVTIFRNRIYNNQSGIELTGPYVSIENNFIYNNTYLGGIDISGTGLVCRILQNVIFNNSSGSFGGGVTLTFWELSGSDTCAWIIGNTICNNRGIHKNGVGYEVYISSHNNSGRKKIITDNIIYNISGAGIMIWDTTDTDFSVNFNCISRQNPQGQGNISADPIFVNPTTFIATGTIPQDVSWMLKGWSPCINAADSSLFGFDINLDIAGNPRITGLRSDMGAYEYQGPFAVDDRTRDNYLNIAPNPVTGNMEVSWRLDQPVQNRYLVIRIHDPLGREMLEKRIDQQQGKVTLPAPDASGLYCLSLCADQTVLQTLRFIVNR